MVEIPYPHLVSIFGHVVKAEHRQQVALGRVKKTLAGRVIGTMTPFYFMIFALHVEEGFRGQGIGRELMTRIEGIGRMSVPMKACFFAPSPELTSFALHCGYSLKDPDKASQALYEKRFSGELEDWWTGTVPDVVFSWKKSWTKNIRRLP